MGNLPQYKQVYEALRREISSGEFSAGDLLPSEHELCARFSVARPTVRKALDQLVSDGFIFKHQGKGSIVKGAPKGIGILSISGTSAAVGSPNFSTHIILKPELRTWTEAFSFPVEEWERRAGCIYFERLRLLDGVPVFFDITMLPNVGLPRFLNYDLENRSLFDSLRSQYQITVTGGTQQLFAIRAEAPAGISGRTCGASDSAAQPQDRDIPARVSHIQSGLLRDAGLRADRYLLNYFRSFALSVSELKNEEDMSQIRQCAVDTIHAEADAVSRLATLLTDDFEGAVRAILACTGKVVVTGMGKSGLIGKKIAATLASTGTPAFFLHPGEAYHGDLGMISRNDIVLAMANSGQTDEILRLIPFMQRNGNRIIAMTGNPESTLAKNAHYHLNVNVTREACPMNLAPTSSTTAMLVMGDALAIALIRERNFRPEDYAVFHPGGSLGRRLLTRVRDVMRKDIPCVEPTATLGDVIIRISDARLGIAAIVEQGRLTGVITDGDVRRAMTKYKENFFNIEARQIMSRSPKTVSPDARITEAEEMMRTHKIHSIVVTDESGGPVGVVEFFNVSVLG